MRFNRWHVIMIILTLLCMGASIVIPLACYDLPQDKYPTHFNLSGEPDSWSNKSLGSLLTGPIIVAVTTLIMLPVAWWIARVPDPRKIINGPKEKIKKMPIERAEQIRKVIVFHLLLITLLVSVTMFVIAVETVIVAVGKKTTIGPSGLIITVFLLADSLYMTLKLLRLVYK